MGSHTVRRGHDSSDLTAAAMKSRQIFFIGSKTDQNLIKVEMVIKSKSETLKRLR